MSNFRSGNELAANDHRVDLPGVADLNKRIGVEQDEIGDLGFLNRAGGIIESSFVWCQACDFAI